MLNVNKKLGFPIVSFTPDFFRFAIKQYESGDYRQVIRLMEKAQLDSRVSGCLIGRRAGYAKDWRVIEASENTEDIKAKEFVESVFLSLDMRYLFNSIFDAIAKKYSVIEYTWAIENGKHIITKVKKLSQKYFKFDKEEQLKIDNGILIDIDKEAALVCEYYTLPILLPALRDYILKEFGVETWSSFVETFGEPFVLGKYPPGMNQTNITALENGIKSLASGTRGLIPDDSTVEIIETQKSVGDHEKYVAFADAGISISILGHADAVSATKGTQIGDNQSSYRVRRDIALDDIAFIENQVSKVIKVLCDRNFNVTKYPVFTIDRSEPINVTERIKVLQTAYDMGLLIHPNEFGKLGIHIIDGQEPLKNPLTIGVE